MNSGDGADSIVTGDGRDDIDGGFGSNVIDCGDGNDSIATSDNPASGTDSVLDETHPKNVRVR